MNIKLKYSYSWTKNVLNSQTVSKNLFWLGRWPALTVVVMDHPVVDRLTSEANLSHSSRQFNLWHEEAGSFAPHGPTGQVLFHEISLCKTLPYQKTAAFICLGKSCRRKRVHLNWFKDGETARKTTLCTSQVMRWKTAHGHFRDLMKSNVYTRFCRMFRGDIYTVARCVLYFTHISHLLQLECIVRLQVYKNHITVNS